MPSAEMPKKLGSELERIVLERIANNRLVLPAMPAVPQRCLEILKEPDFNVRKLVKELESEPVLALLGGFSASLVYRILQRLVDTLDSLFQPHPSSK